MPDSGGVWKSNLNNNRVFTILFLHFPLVLVSFLKIYQTLKAISLLILQCHLTMYNTFPNSFSPRSCQSVAASDV